jgi:beta-glucosidase
MIGGQVYKIVIDTLSTVAPPPPPPAFQIAPQATQVGFFENLETPDMIDLQELAKSAEVSVIFTGNTKDWESESFDRFTMGLSPGQDAMVTAIAAASKKTIVVNQTGAPITMPWLNQVDAVIQCWFAGMEVGNAIADILVGAACPSGRLPTTFPIRIEDVPSNANFPADSNLDIVYAEGMDIGYRAIRNGTSPAPMFAFGHGLSYASFDYSNFNITESKSKDCYVSISVDITNTSKIDAKTVVQLYVDGVLKAFQKPTVLTGQSVHLGINLDKYAFSEWEPESEDGKLGHWVVKPREYIIDLREDAQTPIVGISYTVQEEHACTWKGL